jgi:hypothetical protein
MQFKYNSLRICKHFYNTYISLPVQTVPKSHEIFFTIGTGSIFWGVKGRGVALTNAPLHSAGV